MTKLIDMKTVNTYFGILCIILWLITNPSFAQTPCEERLAEREETIKDLRSLRDSKAKEIEEQKEEIEKLDQKN